METPSASLAAFERNPPATDGFPSQRAISTEFDVFFMEALASCWINSLTADVVGHHDAHVASL